MWRSLATLFWLVAPLLLARPAAADWGLFVASSGNNAVYKFNTNAVPTVFATNGVNGVALSNPLGVALDDLGGLYLVNYTFHTTNDTVERYDGQGVGSVFATLIGSDGLYGAAMDVSNNVYVADYGSSKILKITNPGGQVSTFAAIATLDGPTGMTFDDAGNLWVANNYGGSIEQFDPQGNGTQFYKYSANSGPVDLAFDSAGNLYVTEDNAGKVGKFAAGTTNRTDFVTGLSAPFGLAFDSTGNLYVACNGNNTIEKITPSGTPSVFASASTGLKSPGFIAIQETRYQANWNKVAGGGGTSTNAEFMLNGTIGQQDAGAVMTGGRYGLAGGFWARISAMPTPGAPTLTITITTTNTAMVSWPSPSSGWNPQQNTNLATAIWVASPAPTDNGTIKYLIVNPPAGNLFFRLANP